MEDIELPLEIGGIPPQASVEVDIDQEKQTFRVRAVEPDGAATPGRRITR